VNMMALDDRRQGDAVARAFDQDRVVFPYYTRFAGRRGRVVMRSEGNRVDMAGHVRPYMAIVLLDDGRLVRSSSRYFNELNGD